MTPTLSPRTVRLLMALFFLHPFALGGWFAQIPLVQANLGLTNAQLALALLGMPVAFITMSKLAARVVGRCGAPFVFITVFPLQTATALFPLYALSQITLFVALVIFGSAVAFLSVALNVYAGQYEKASGTSVMNRCHGFWALGLMVGSLLAAILAKPLSPDLIILVLAASSAAVAMWFARSLPNLKQQTSQDPQKTPRRKLRDYPNALFLIVLFVVSVTMTEGAMTNWGAVYMAERLSEGATTAGLAITVYSGSLAFGRFVGDFLKVRIGAANLARLTVGVAILGILLLVAPLPPVVAFVGFACVGLGVSVGFPLAVSAAAALEDAHDADNIAFLSIIAVGSNVIAPPIIGLLADSIGMTFALAALLPGLCLSLIMARHLSSNALRTAPVRSKQADAA